MLDPFGNYLVQKLVEKCGDKQLLSVVQTIRDQPLEICKDLHGTRSIQKIVEFLADSHHKTVFAEYLLNDFVPLTCEINGNHVL